MHLGNDCFDVDDAFGALIRGNTSIVTDDGGLLEISDSDEARILDNVGEGSDSPGIETDDMADFIVDGNVMRDASDNGIDIHGVDFELTNNKVVGFTDDPAIDVEVSANPTDTLIANNVATAYVPDDDNGIEITADSYSAACAAPPCVRILNNRLSNSVQDGYRIFAHYAEIRGNVVTNTGESDGSQGNGFALTVGTSTVVQNTAENTASDGFRFTGSDNNLISENVSKGNGIDGLHFVSSDLGMSNTIDGNQIIGNHGDGIEIDATNVLVTNNTSKKNRYDCAASEPLDGASAGNVCADGSDFTQDGTVD